MGVYLYWSECYWYDFVFKRYTIVAYTSSFAGPLRAHPEVRGEDPERLACEDGEAAGREDPQRHVIHKYTTNMIQSTNHDNNDDYLCIYIYIYTHTQ